MISPGALQRLDMLVGAAVEEEPLASPPDAPEVGSCYIVAAGASGVWAGKDQCLAAYSSGGWRTVAPPDGMSVYVRSTGTFATFRDGAWEVGAARCSALVIGGQQVVGSARPPIDAPAGGGTVDPQARAAIGDILAALRDHGLIQR
jgi:hypothetical protein